MDSKQDDFAEKIQRDIIEDLKKTYSKKVLEYWAYPRNLNDMENPDGFSEYAGLCGDTLKIYLKIKDDKIEQATFLTDGCGATIACGSMITEIITNKNIQEAWNINREVILDKLGGLPEEHEHCAALAETTLHMALINYEKIKKGFNESKLKGEE